MKFINGLHVVKDDLFEIPALFKLIKTETNTDLHEMYQVFNMGHRMEIYLNQTIAEEIISISESFGVDAKVIGRVEKSDKNKLTIMDTHVYE